MVLGCQFFQANLQKLTYAEMERVFTTLTVFYFNTYVNIFETSIIVPTVAEVHYWCQFTQVLVPRHPPVQWYHLGSVPRRQASGGRLQGVPGCHDPSGWEEESPVCGLLQGETDPDLRNDDCQTRVRMGIFEKLPKDYRIHLIYNYLHLNFWRSLISIVKNILGFWKWLGSLHHWFFNVFKSSIHQIFKKNNFNYSEYLGLTVFNFSSIWLKKFRKYI